MCFTCLPIPASVNLFHSFFFLSLETGALYIVQAECCEGQQLLGGHGFCTPWTTRVMEAQTKKEQQEKLTQDINMVLHNCME